MSQRQRQRQLAADHLQPSPDISYVYSHQGQMGHETKVDTNTRETQHRCRYRYRRSIHSCGGHTHPFAFSIICILILTSQLFVVLWTIVPAKGDQLNYRLRMNDHLSAAVSSYASSLLPGPIRISSNTWGELDQLTINVTQSQYQPNHIWNDRIQSNLWYISYTKSYAPLVIRYDIWTNTTIVLFTGWIAYGGILAMTQDEMGRLFLVQNSGVISYFEAPYLPTPNTTMITLIDPAEGMMTGVSVIASGGFAWISVTQPPSPPNVTAVVIRFNLTDSTSTTSLGSDVCPLQLLTGGLKLSEDWVNSAILVTCVSGIWSIPMNPTNSSSPFLLVPRSKSFVPVGHQRGRDCLFISFLNDTIEVPQPGLLAWYNESTYHSLVEFNPKGCAGLNEFLYSRPTDSVWIICSSTSATSSLTSNVLSVQNSANGVVGGSQTLITNACNAQMGLQDLQIGPNGLYLACDDGVFHLSGGSLTTLISSPTCLSVNDLQTDDETNLLYLACDQQLLVLDGDIQYPLSLVGDCQQLDQIVALQLGTGGVVYLVTYYGPSAYEVCVLDPITPESLLISNTVVTKSLGQYQIQPNLWVSDDLVFLLLIDFTSQTPLFLNSTTSQWQPFLSNDYCQAISSLAVMNQFVYIGCEPDGIIALPINNLTSAIPQSIWNVSSSTEADSYQCSESFTVTPSPMTNELWISCLDANQNETIVILNLTDYSSRNLTLLTGENGFPDTIVLDLTSPLLFLVGLNLPYDRSYIGLQVYDPTTNTVMVAPITNELCDSILAYRLNPISGVSYMSCVNGNVIAQSKQFNCQAGYQWQRNQCQSCPVGRARALTPCETWANRIPRCQQCSPGSIAMQQGSSTCQPCPIGRYQDLSMQQQQVCLYCQPGTAQNLTGQTSCPPCPAGQFATNVGLTQCELCPPGRYSNSNTSDVCSLCDRGSASSVWGLNTTCPLCRSGTEQLQYGGLTCSTCPLGSFAPQGDPCSTCPLHSYQSTIGHPCVPCDGNGQDGLYCEGGLAYVKEGWCAYQMYDENLHQWIYLTTECPDTFCPGSQLQVSNSSSVNGTDASIEYCLYPRLNSLYNLLCAACADHYIVWGQECVECNEANPLDLVLIILFLFILVGFLLRSSTESAGHLNILLFFIQTAALELRARQTTSTTNWIQIFNLGFLSFNTCVGPMTPLQQILLMYLSPLILLIILIFIGCLHRLLQPRRLLPQLIHKFSLNKYIACIMTILLFCYTNVTVSVVETFNCVEVTPGVTVLWSQPTVDCSSDGYHQLLILTIIWLVVYVIGFPIAIFFFLLRRHSRAIAASSPSIVGLNLTNDLTEPLHHSLALAAKRKVPTTPSAASLMHSQSMSERTFILSGTESDLRWGGLFLSFTHTAWYWQSWILVRRFAFALISVLLYQSPNLAFILFTGLNIFCLLIHLATEPFTATILNRIDTCAYILLIAVSLILAGTSNRASSSSVWLEMILFALIVLPAFLFLIYTLRYRLRLLHQRRLERKSRTAAIMNDTSQPMKEKSSREIEDESESEEEKEELNETSHPNDSI